MEDAVVPRVAGARAAGELERLDALARRFKLRGRVAYSDNARKRFMYMPTDIEMERYDLPEKIRFGDPHATTYFDDHTLVEKRKAWRARFCKIKLKDGRASYKVKFTPAFLSWYLLW